MVEGRLEVRRLGRKEKEEGWVEGSGVKNEGKEGEGPKKTVLGTLDCAGEFGHRTGRKLGRTMRKFAGPRLLW